MAFRKTTLTSLVLLLSWQISSALVIKGYNATKHDRFINFLGEATHNTNFIFGHLNMTGVGWKQTDPRRQYTMVSPLHFVGATHVSPGIGQTLQFLTPGNEFRAFTVATQTPILNASGQETDLFIGKLSQAIPSIDSIQHHPYLNSNNTNSYLNKPLIILGTRALGGRQTSTTFLNLSFNGRLTRTIRSQYIDSNAVNDDCFYESGDSGGPTMIEQNGVAAVIGTNSAVSLDSTTNYTNFIPHYIDELNAIMEIDGYRMTKSSPGITTLTLTHQAPISLVRAGHPFTVSLTLINTRSALGENLKLTNTLSTGIVANNSTGTGWFDESTGASTKARKASLSGRTSSNYSITFTIPTAGTAKHQVIYSCDQSPAVTENFSLDVIESYLSWSSALSDQTSTGDDDLDGISNLLEYAFGGEPTSSSQKLPGSTISLLPVYNGNSVTYLRRTDYADRALTYVLTSSPTMMVGSWLNASGMVSQTTITPVAGSDFEQVKLDLTHSGTERFFRIKITLNE